MSEPQELRDAREHIPRDLELTKRTVVTVFTPEFRPDGTVERPNGSGVLVEAGGHHFVFTAGHVIEGSSLAQIAVGFPTAVIVLPVEPGFGIARAERKPDSDVAYIELDRNKEWRWKDMCPLSVHNVASCPVKSDSVLLCGFPYEMSSSDSFVTPPERAGGKPVMQAAGGHGAITLRTHIARGARHELEPPEGRGFHVGFNIIEDPELGGRKRIAPHGVSGGPVFLFDEAPARLLGLVRSRHDGLLWCEPVCEVLQLLAEHPSHTVASDAKAALATLMEQQ